MLSSKATDIMDMKARPPQTERKKNMYNAKPVIGLTGAYKQDSETQQHFLNQSYFEAIRHFGGIPLLIPVFAEPDEEAFLLSQCDGLLLTGGDDIDPALFGEEVLNDTVSITPERDNAEYRHLDIAVKRDLPIFGICRGIQVLNVYFGGTLYQDIPAQILSPVSHRMEKPFHRTCHDCIVEPDSPLHRLTDVRSFGVNSHHHQAVKNLAPGFVTLGRSEDGIVEAICHPGKPFCWGVQWHPERIWDIEPSSAKLFECFISACK